MTTSLALATLAITNATLTGGPSFGSASAPAKWVVAVFLVCIVGGALYCSLSDMFFDRVAGFMAGALAGMLGATFITGAVWAVTYLFS